MAYKDEYEVARLFADGAFQRQVAEAFEGDLRFEFHLAPPLLARARSGDRARLKKMRFGPWMMPAFRVLAALRGLRGTRVRHLRLYGRAARGARADRRIRGLVRRIQRRPHARQSSDRRRARVAAGKNPRLWPCEGARDRGGAARARAAARSLARPADAIAGGRIVAAVDASRVVRPPRRWRRRVLMRIAFGRIPFSCA